MNTFQIPVTSADRAMTEVGNPHDRYIVYPTPTAM